MFKKFSEEGVSSIAPVKSSVARGIRAKVLERYPTAEAILDEACPKKTPMRIAKCAEKVQILVTEDGEALFFCDRDGIWYPSLKLAHKYPNLLPHVQVDRGAVKHVLGGANIMCPGLTSKGGKLDTPIDANEPCLVMVEGKEHALAIGLTKMSTADIQAINKDIGIDTIHYLNDGLWRTDKVTK